MGWMSAPALHVSFCKQEQQQTCGLSRGQATSFSLHPIIACRYITGEELTSVSSYMRGRLTADKCNAALDELAGLAEVVGWAGMGSCFMAGLM